MKKLLSLLLVVLMMGGSMNTVAMAETITELPRQETLSFNGMIWGTASSFNPLESGGNVGFGICTGAILIYEPLYMYNMLTNVNEPLIAADEPVLSEDGMQFTIKLKENVTFNDGQALTAADVVFSYQVHNKNLYEGIVTPRGDLWTYISGIEAVDDYTVVVSLNENNYNPLLVQSYFASVLILPEHIWATRWDEYGADMTALYNEDTVGTGPYKLFIADDARNVLVRVDSYWGQADNMFGKLAEPKYLLHQLFQDNNAGNIAFSEGRVDVSQQFLPSVWEYQASMQDENGNTLVHTYYDGAPYQLGWGIPSLLFNLTAPGLSDSLVRRALAMSLDYEAIATNAMSGYSDDIMISLYNLHIHGDYIDLEDETTQELMWDTTDLEGNIATANEMLEEAGYIDIDGDGIRELPDGSKYEWKAECPYGWSDWNASLEIFVEGAKKIGLNVVTYFPEAAMYFQDRGIGNYDILMTSPYPNPSVANPWQVAFNILYSKGVAPIGEFYSRNTNRFSDVRVDELVELSMVETDPELLIEYYSEINQIWLKELPTVPLMYRPFWFQTVYSGYWTGYATADDGTQTPPLLLSIDAGIKGLYMITAK